MTANSHSRLDQRTSTSLKHQSLSNLAWERRTLRSRTSSGTAGRFVILAGKFWSISIGSLYERIAPRNQLSECQTIAADKGFVCVLMSSPDSAMQVVNPVTSSVIAIPPLHAKIAVSEIIQGWSDECCRGLLLFHVVCRLGDRTLGEFLGAV